MKSGSSIPLIGNREARRLFLAASCLTEPPVGAADGEPLLEQVEKLGFVQIDSVNTVERAHHMILFARRQRYRPKKLSPLLERERSLFEHWTHDASIIPTKYFPYWRLRFERDAEGLRERWRNWQGAGFEARFDEVLKKISDCGPVTSGQLAEERAGGGWWQWHPSKTALEFLWRTGKLAICRRDGFRKIYDLTERVIPSGYLAAVPDVEETIDWACNGALSRLGFATSGELAAFWDIVRPAEAKNWCDRELALGRIIELDVECAQPGKTRRMFARPETVELTARVHPPAARIRVLSPFDPALRNRGRTERLFGFHYRIEIFVPEAKRRYGYYIFPVLEGERLIGRIDMKALRSEGCLAVAAFWPERNIRWGAGRQRRLEAELERIARLARCRDIHFSTGWLRPPQ
jgi:uncharacterized protein